MTKKNILHMISPQGNVSPFDVNMACDAGYDLLSLTQMLILLM